jgi:diguanylate cyclase (GGDEF)-like protein
MLTGLYNRRTFYDEFNKALASSHATDAPLAVALVDIDQFKKINDTYGHTAGDEVIRAVAGKISEIAGQNAIISRYGGDEILILFPGLEREQGFLCLENMRLEIEKRQIPNPNKESETIKGITISAGIAAFPVDGRTEFELMRKADQALYRAKLAGRNRIRLAFEEKMVPKTSHFPQTQLERLSKLAAEHSLGEAELLREALDDLLVKYGVNEIES